MGSAELIEILKAQCLKTQWFAKKKQMLLQVMLWFLFFGVVSAGAVETILPDNVNLKYTGVVESEINSQYAKLYRHISEIRENDGGGYWLASKAGNQAGMTIRFRTASPEVTLHFQKDPDFESRWGRMALFRNGVKVADRNVAPADQYEISATGQSAESADWVFTFPGWQPMWLTSIELADGYELETVPDENKPLYIAVGNSITHGVGQSGNATHLSYGWQVAEALEMDFLNIAIGGSKTNTRMLQSMSGKDPALITVLWGYNDVHSPWPLARALDSMENVVDYLLEQFPEAEIWMLGTPYSENEVGLQNSSNTLSDLRSGIAAIVEARQGAYPQLKYWDASTVVSSMELLSDGVHLNDEGAADLAAGFISAYEEEYGISSSENPSSSALSDSPHIIYVATAGSDLNGDGSANNPYGSIGKGVGLAEAGDTVLVLPGVYQNAGYGEGLENAAVASFWNKSGEPGAPIVLKSYEKHGAKIQFDGAGGIIAGGLSYFEIDGFEIEGPGASIDSSEARSHRLDNPALPYYSGRGIALWGGASGSNHHIVIRNVKAHHAPNSGIRINFGDYILYEDNEVYSNCWDGSAAESGLVIAQATNIDDLDSTKITIRRNKVWNNGNYVVFYNPAAGEGGDYGQTEHTEIVDGQGIYTTRNNDTWLAGSMLIENNLSVNNGINGIVYHQTPRGIIRNNTVYKNGQYPERPISGITVNGSEDVQIYHNIIVGRNDIVLENYNNSTQLDVFENLIWEGTSSLGESSAFSADPLFVNPDINPLLGDFSLSYESPAVNGAQTSSDISEDILGRLREMDSIDLGAYEYFLTTKFYLGRNSTAVETGRAEKVDALGRALYLQKTFSFQPPLYSIP
jgi:lysophospholipase L1-like esterase